MDDGDARLISTQSSSAAVGPRLAHTATVIASRSTNLGCELPAFLAVPRLVLDLKSVKLWLANLLR